MVHVNAFYMIAWGMFDRDYYYRFGKDSTQKGVDYLALTDHYLPSRKKRVQEYLNKNIAEARSNDGNTERLYREYRNKVVHLNICHDFSDLVEGIRNPGSYFDVYAFAVQNWALRQDFLGVFRTSLKHDIDTYRTYQRDFLKILNLPFAYNEPRYKNLTIADLFNDKYRVKTVD